LQKNKTVHLLPHMVVLYGLSMSSSLRMAENAMLYIR